MRRVLSILCTLLFCGLVVAPSSPASMASSRAYTTTTWGQALPFTAPIPGGVMSPFPQLYWHLYTIGAQDAWSAEADGHGVSVLVIDTGLDRTEATTVLSGQVLPSLAVNPLHGSVPVQCKTYNPYVSCSKDITIPNASPYVDKVGHGSFVLCEIVCNGQYADYYGVAPKAKAAIAKVFDGEGADDRDVAAAIMWGAIHRFSVISMSLGGSSSDPATAAAVAYAEKVGVIVVAAAGNNGQNAQMYPGSYPGVIRVSATDRWNHITSWSTYGPDVAIASPGDYIFGIAPMRPTLINCAGLCTWEGTSMATPLVAGAVADLLSAGLTPDQAKEALLKGAGWSHFMDPLHYGHGLLSLSGSLRYARAQGWLK